MTWPPVDSADVAELREIDDAQPPLHDPTCEHGWLPDAEDGRPRPCPACRPHLIALADGRVVHRSTLRARH